MTEASASRPSFVIVVGGAGARLTSALDLTDHVVVIAADSGLDVALDLGYAVHHVVGDLDSVRPESLDAAVVAGASVHRHPADKDATDFELACELVLDLASARGGVADAALLVVGPGGGRQDMTIGDLLALAGPRLVDLEVTARYGEAIWLVVRPGRTRRFSAEPQEQISLLPVHGRAHGVTATGLRWPLLEAELSAGTTRGVSNVAVDAEVSVSIDAGVLLVCRPGMTAPHVDPRPDPTRPQPTRPDATRPDATQSGVPDDR